MIDITGSRTGPVSYIRHTEYCGCNICPHCGKPRRPFGTIRPMDYRTLC